MNNFELNESVILKRIKFRNSQIMHFNFFDNNEDVLVSSNKKSGKMR